MSDKVYYKLTIKNFTWAKDNDNLHNYKDNTYKNTVTVPLNYNCLINDLVLTLYRQKDDRISTRKSKQNKFFTNIMIAQNQIKGNIILKFNGCQESDIYDEQQTKQSQTPVGIVVNKFINTQNGLYGFPLYVGLTILLGRIKFCVRQTYKGKSQQTDLKILAFNQDNQDQCKICLQSQTTDDNFIFTPCKCRGSCGAVHYQCLKSWINVKMGKQLISKGITQFKSGNYQCEACKDQLPMTIQVNGKILSLFDFDRPQDPYVMIEGMSQKQKRILILEDISQDGIVIGRSQDCQIQIVGKTASRDHATIKRIGSQFYIIDNDSKFGTIVFERGKQTRLVLNKHPVSVQIGRTVLALRIQKQ